MRRTRLALIGIIGALFCLTAMAATLPSTTPTTPDQGRYSDPHHGMELPAPDLLADPTVYVTDSGKKYHTSGCRYLKKSKHAIKLSKAKSQGYTPCKVCKPPR